MNLYEIQFTHYAPKDSEKGIYGYLIAESDEEVYNWLRENPEINNTKLWNSYDIKEEEHKNYSIYDDNYNVIGHETFKERMIRLHGEMYDDEHELWDLYYGATTIGWELKQTNVTMRDVRTLMELNIPIVINKKGD